MDVDEPEQVGAVGGSEATLHEDGRSVVVDAHRLHDVFGVGSGPLLAHESDERLRPVQGPIGTVLDEVGREEGTQAVVVAGVDGLVVRHRCVATVHTAPFVGGRMNRSVHVMTTV